MKAVILASGYGTRLRPLTDKTPKCMLPIKSKPFLEYVLEYLTQNDIKDFIVKVAYKSEQFLKYKGFKKYNIEWVISDEPLGTAGEVKACIEYLKNEDDFVIYYGDTLTNLNLETLIRKHQNNENVLTMTAYRGERSRYGVFYFDPFNRYSHFKEKPLLQHWVNCPIMIASRRFLSYCEEGRDISKDIIPILTEQYAIGVYRDERLKVIDIGSVDEYKKYCEEGFNLGGEKDGK